MKNVLVTGADGQLGKCIQEIAGNYKNIRVYFANSQELDITRFDNVTATFELDNFGYCINCAAFTDVEQAEKTPEPAFEVNAEGVKNLALACKRHNMALIHISTDYVFDGEKKGPYFPDDPTNPINIYGKSKLKGEMYVQEILSQHHIVRTSWLYSRHGRNFYTTILEKAKKGEALHITDQQKGCPTNADNLAAFVMGIIENGNEKYGIHHFTDGEVMTWFDFAKRILQENGLIDTIALTRADNYRTFARRPRNSVLANSTDLSSKMGEKI